MLLINCYFENRSGGRGTDLGYQPVALSYVFWEKDEKLTPPPQVGIDTNLQFDIFQKKGTYTPTTSIDTNGHCG